MQTDTTNPTPANDPAEAGSPTLTSSAIYTISPGYRKATIWIPAKDSRERMAVCTITPKKGTTRWEKYDSIRRGLEHWSITPPDYKPTAAEQNH